MKPFLVATAASQEYFPLAQITEKTKRHYASRHGYDFQNFKHRYTSRIPWERVEIWKFALEICGEWLFFTGCDVAITNPTILLESLIDPETDFIFALDGCGLQSDSWLMRKCPATQRFLDKVLTWEGKLWNEQDAMSLELSGETVLSNFMANFPPREAGGKPCSLDAMKLYQKAFEGSEVRCKIVPQWVLNAYPSAEYGGTGEEGWSWNLLDFCLHLPGKSLEERVKFFKKLTETV